jgi:hypothetical protein
VRQSRRDSGLAVLCTGAACSQSTFGERRKPLWTSMLIGLAVVLAPASLDREGTHGYDAQYEEFSVARRSCLK